jgi:hypothetical protein
MRILGKNAFLLIGVLIPMRCLDRRFSWTSAVPSALIHIRSLGRWLAMAYLFCFPWRSTTRVSWRDANNCRNNEKHSPLEGRKAGDETRNDY